MKRPAWRGIGLVACGAAATVGGSLFVLESAGPLAVAGIGLMAGATLLALTPGWAESLWVVFAASLVTLPFGEIRWAFGGLSVPVPALVATLALAVLAVRVLTRAGPGLRQPEMLVSLAVLLLGQVLSLVAAESVETTLPLLLKWGFHALLFCFLVSVADRRWHLWTLVTLVLVTGTLSAYGLVEYVREGQDYVNFYAEVGTRTGTGLHIALVLPLAVSLCMARGVSWRLRVAAGTAGMTSLAALALTYSRSAWLSVLVGAVVAGVLRRRIWVLVLVVLAIVYLAHGAPMEIQERFLSIFSRADADPAVSNALRLRLQALALATIWAHPVFGVGLGNFAIQAPWYLYNVQSPSSNLPHNFYLRVWAEGGIVAFVGFIGFAFFVVRRVLRTRRSAPAGTGQGITLGMTASVVTLLTFMLFSDDFNNIVVWTVLGLAVSGARLWAPEASTVGHRREPLVAVRRPGRVPAVVAMGR